MEIWKKEKDNPWLKRLLEMEVGQKAPIELKSRGTVRSVIGDKIKNDHPEMEFTTKIVDAQTLVGTDIPVSQRYLEVERLK